MYVIMMKLMFNVNYLGRRVCIIVINNINVESINLILIDNK